MKKEITKEEYDRLSMQEAFNYDDVTTYKCGTEGCEEYGKEVISDSRETVPAFIYANRRMKDGNLVLRHVTNTSVCDRDWETSS